MKRLFDVVRVANEGRTLFYNFVPKRGVRYQETIKWVQPEKKPVYHPACTGDLVGFPGAKLDSISLPFKDSKELENADEKVKRVFSLEYQMPNGVLQIYTNELEEKVKSHAHDTNSDEVKIARLTAVIRYYQSIIVTRPAKYGKLIKSVKEKVDYRKKLLKLLRLKDYKKFEWLLEKLDLEYRPPVAVTENKVTRNKSLTLLAMLKAKQVKEMKLAAYKKELDEKKVPFLEKKIMKLKEIMEYEKKYNLPVTVTDEDIQEIVEKLEKVKVQVDENLKRGYQRKIHPYFLEEYEEDLLWKKEKAAELLREKREKEQQQKMSVETNVL